MREKWREAAGALWGERHATKREGGDDGGEEGKGKGKEVYVDLHGLHPEEAVSYLAACLQEHSSSRVEKSSAGVWPPVYAICGTGQHGSGNGNSKNAGKDKVGKAVRAFLGEGGFAFREFGVQGDRSGGGGILGIDVGSAGGAVGGGEKKEGSGDADDGDSGVALVGEGGGETKGEAVVGEDARQAVQGQAVEDGES